uniref:Uncharacterized protein n=1 Tax=Oryza sativa subsp. japonica TaxID=39947 RepID=Q6H8C9_ORYSJ|nr:hypothetical protein [Oryza sativa Japonica Group]
MAAAAARWPRFFVLRPAVALLLLLLLLPLHATAASPTTESSAGNDTVARPDPCIFFYEYSIYRSQI